MILPVRSSLPRRRNRVATGRIHLRGASAGNHADIRVATDEGDGPNFFWVERQHGVVVLEQHDAVFFQALGDFQSAWRIHHAFLDGMIHHAGKEFGVQNAAHMVINFGKRHFAVFYRLQERRTEKISHGLFLIQTSRGSFHRAVGAIPIGDDEALKSPIFLEHVTQQIRVLARVISVDEIVGTHHRAGIRDIDADVESEQIAFLHGSFGDDHVDDIPAGFLIVDGVMLEVANDVLGLFAFHQIADHGPGEQRIFAGIFEGAAVAGFAGEIYAATERHVKTLRSQFPADQRAVFAGGLRIPTRSGRQRGWQRGGVTAVRSAIANTVGGVRNK